MMSCECIECPECHGTGTVFFSFDGRYLGSSSCKEERDVYFQQVWEIPGAKGTKETSSFPDVIPERLIKMFSVKGDVVLDPFCGTGTTVKVASKLGRVGVGIIL